MLEINEVRIKKINKGKFLGYASILIQNSLVIDGIELHDGEKGRYIYMPLNPKMKKSRVDIRKIWWNRRIENYKGRYIKFCIFF